MDDALSSFRASGDQGLEIQMTNAYKFTTASSSAKEMTADQMAEAIRRQAIAVGVVGEIDLFGYARTESNIASALSELSRVAAAFAAELQSRSL